MTAFRDIRERGRKRGQAVARITAEALPDPDLQIGISRPAEHSGATRVHVQIRIMADYLIPDVVSDAHVHQAARLCYERLAAYASAHFVEHRPKLLVVPPSDPTTKR